MLVEVAAAAAEDVAAVAEVAAAEVVAAAGEVADPSAGVPPEIA